MMRLTYAGPTRPSGHLQPWETQPGTAFPSQASETVTWVGSGAFLVLATVYICWPWQRPYRSSLQRILLYHGTVGPCIDVA